MAPRCPRVRAGLLSLGLTLTACLTVPASATAATSASSAATSAADTTSVAALTVEELRLDRAVPREILAASGFDTVAPELARRLGTAHSYAQARRVVVGEGSALWRRACA
ncbi:hypothetical protein [Streptomyces sp. ID05-47C]|uniref:hypothetical protein n=1 Tax=Streptomyces sp. ID05-47C TaxID=3028665 RepID=UPI0039F4B72D